MNKSIRLLGENKNTTIIVGVIGRDVVYVYDYGVTISEFSLQYHCTYPSSDIMILTNQTYIYQMIMTRTSNWFGIPLHSFCDARIYDNRISNKVVGISLRVFSNNNSIIENTLTNNYYNIEVLSSLCNHIYYNNFVNNIINAVDKGSSTYNDTYLSAGNYWDGYTVINEH